MNYTPNTSIGRWRESLYNTSWIVEGNLSCGSETKGEWKKREIFKVSGLFTQCYHISIINMISKFQHIILNIMVIVNISALFLTEGVDMKIQYTCTTVQNICISVMKYLHCSGVSFKILIYLKTISQWNLLKILYIMIQ